PMTSEFSDPAPVAPGQESTPDNAPEKAAGESSALALLDLDEVKDRAGNFSRELLAALAQRFRTTAGLTDAEMAIAARAAEEVAVCHILGIGAPQPILERLQVRAQRAQSTLIQIFAGEAVESKAAVRDALHQVVQRIFRSALAFLTRTAIA